MAGSTGESSRGGRLDSLVPGVEGGRHQRRSSTDTATSGMKRVSVERKIRGLKMKKLFARVGTFSRTLRECLSEAWLDSDCHYNIPKSRFKDPASDAQVRSALPRREKGVPRNAFLGSFRDCVAQAWKDTDVRYHIPKSRFMDAEDNGKTYHTTQEGIWSRVKAHLRILKSCISTAWDESGHYHHLPKSQYKYPVFLKDKMDSAPKPEGLPPLTTHYVGLGVVGESSEEGWTAGSKQNPQDKVFVVPEDGAGGGRKPEIGME